MVNSENFHPKRGHVQHGQKIIAPSGKEFTLKSQIRGWMVYGPDDLPVSGYLTSAKDVTWFIVVGLQSS